jgi:hypothetical protein
MNPVEADDALTEAVGQLEWASRLLERAKNAAYVAETNRGYAERHYDAMVALVAQRERVLREVTIAGEGGYQP